MRLETLKRRSDFDRLRQGRKWVAKGFILQGMPQKPGLAQGQPRFGFVVGSKALKDKESGAKRPGAVLRNRARRRLKEAIRLLAPAHAKADFDYVIIGRRESLHQRFDHLLEDFQIAFGKVNRTPRADDGKARSAKASRASAKDSLRQTEEL